MVEPRSVAVETRSGVTSALVTPAPEVAASFPDGPFIRIEPTGKRPRLSLNEVWAYRELLYFLVWRDVKVRYKQTALGIAWAVVQPLLTMVVFSLFFGRLARVPSEGVPYPIFSYAALLPWSFFAQGLLQSTNSVVGGANLIRKVYFPRLVIPLSSVLGGVVDVALAFLILLGMMAYYGMRPTAAVFWLPAFVLLTLITTLAVGFWLSALNVQFRDVRYIVPFLTQLWLFATPIAYSSGLLSEPWRTVYGLNPMVGVVEGFRWALLGTKAPAPMIAVSAVIAVGLLLAGLVYFRRAERTFADVV